MAVSRNALRSSSLALLVSLAAAHNASADRATWKYVVAIHPGELEIEATLPASASGMWSVDKETAAFVSAVTLLGSGAGGTLVGHSGKWQVRNCTGSCRVHYRFALAEAAKRLDDSDEATEMGGLIESPPCAWLLRPMGDDAPEHALITLELHASPLTSFATGLIERDGRFELEADYIDHSPYTLFGSVTSERLDKVTDADIEIVRSPRFSTLTALEVRDWATSAITLLKDYFKTFPGKKLLLGIFPMESGFFGETIGGSGASILLSVGDDATLKEAKEDWVLLHELIHVAFPTVGSRYRWAKEGMSTFLEPLIRAQHGSGDGKEFWSSLVDNLPNGVSRGKLGGLDDNRSWGLTYWGGTLFWFLADIEIHRASANRCSIADAFREIVKRGGVNSNEWEWSQAVSVGDAALGAPILKTLYAKVGTRYARVNLNALWERLGVVTKGGVSFDDRAPWASFRKAIITPPREQQSLCAEPNFQLFTWLN